MLNLFSGENTGHIHIGRVGTNVIGMENIRIDRGHSVLCNKFVVHDEIWRNECCDWYNEWLKEEFFSCFDDTVQTEIFRIIAILESGNDVNLQCWCTPKRCHGEEIKKLIFNYMKEKSCSN